MIQPHQCKTLANVLDCNPDSWDAEQAKTLAASINKAISHEMIFVTGANYQIADHASRSLACFEQGLKRAVEDILRFATLLSLSDAPRVEGTGAGVVADDPTL